MSDVCFWHLEDLLSSLAARPLLGVKQTFPTCAAPEKDHSETRGKASMCARVGALHRQDVTANAEDVIPS
jgi:hypothetical protein